MIPGFLDCIIMCKGFSLLGLMFQICKFEMPDRRQLVMSRRQQIYKPGA